MAGACSRPDAASPRRRRCSWAFVGCVVGGVPIGFALAFSALIFIWIEGALPGVIFAQQMARGIDNFVLLAIPFFILVGYLMEANGMSVRLIALLERLVGRAARRAERRDGAVDGDLLRHFRLEDGRRRGGGLGADPGGPAVAAEPGRRGGVAGGLGGDGGDDSALHQPDHPRLRRQSLDRRPVHGGIAAGGADGARADRRGDPASAATRGCRTKPALPRPPLAELVGRRGRHARACSSSSSAASDSAIATATEISAFAALLCAGRWAALAFRELGPRAAARSFVNAATRSGLVLFIVAAAQSLAFVLTLQQIPQALGASDDRAFAEAPARGCSCCCRS